MTDITIKLVNVKVANKTLENTAVTPTNPLVDISLITIIMIVATQFAKLELFTVVNFEDVALRVLMHHQVVHCIRGIRLIFFQHKGNKKELVML